MKRTVGQAVWYSILCFFVLGVSSCFDWNERITLAADSLGNLTDQAYVSADGMSLPLSQWEPSGPVRAIIVAAHGMNDYRMAWARPAARWAKQGIATYAYDQRGFGAAGRPGHWYGAQAMAADLAHIARFAMQRHPGAPLYVMGESMGGAIAILAATRTDMPPLAGIILSAPAIWAPSFSGMIERQLVVTGGILFPEATIPPRGKEPASTDDPAILEQMRSDPLILHDTNFRTLAGVVELMTEAARKAPQVRQSSLILFGDDDLQVDRDGVSALASALPDATVALYPGGRHLLFRSLNDAPIADVAAWVLHPTAALPSGASVRGQLCRAQINDPHDCPPLTQTATGRLSE